LKTKTLNFSNIRSGGAKQVAISFLLELNYKDIEIFNIIVSKEIYDELESLNYEFIELLKIYNSSIFKIFSFSLMPEIRNATVVFTLFGPFYGFTRAKTITGFAQGWILYPENLVYKQISYFEKYKLKFKFLIQLLFFRKDNLLITETNVSKEVLINELNFKNIEVVSNSLNTIYNKHKPEFKKKNLSIKIGVIGKNYPHKNLQILPGILKSLKDDYSVNVSFYVTLTDREFKTMTSNFRKNIKNIGPLNIMDCPDFYKEMDLIFFPSLLEIFSATPLESLYMKKPFICCDLPFNKGFLEKFAFYTRPNNIIDSSRVISEVVELYRSNDPLLKNMLNLGSEYIKQNYKPSNRAKAYLEIINRYE